MPRRSAQTRIEDHFKPSRTRSPRQARSNGNKRATRPASDSDSEGSDALFNIKLTQASEPSSERAIGRARRKVSTIEDERSEEEDSVPTEKRKGMASVNRKNPTARTSPVNTAASMRIIEEENRGYDPDVIVVLDSDEEPAADTLRDIGKDRFDNLKRTAGRTKRGRSSSSEVIDLSQSRASLRRRTIPAINHGSSSTAKRAAAARPGGSTAAPSTSDRRGRHVGPSDSSQAGVHNVTGPSSSKRMSQQGSSRACRQKPFVELASWASEQLKRYVLWDPSLPIGSTNRSGSALAASSPMQASLAIASPREAGHTKTSHVVKPTSPEHEREQAFLDVYDLPERDSSPADESSRRGPGRPNEGSDGSAAPRGAETDDSELSGHEARDVAKPLSAIQSARNKGSRQRAIVARRALTDSEDDVTSNSGPPEESRIQSSRAAAKIGASSTRPRESASRRPRASKSKSAAHDPDESDSERASTDGGEDNDIQLDEMDRFKTASRLRSRTETTFQRNLRKAKNKRLGIVESSSEEGDDDDETSSASEEDHFEDSFIVEDDGQLGDIALPHQFSRDSAQTPEYKFKVVFQYMVLLAVRGSRALPLQGRDARYLVPMLADLRRMIQGYRDSRVRSQIWKTEFVEVLKRYPSMEVDRLDVGHLGCDACHISGRISSWQVRLVGYSYDRNTYQPIESDAEEEADRRRKEKVKEKRRQKRHRRMTSSASDVSSDTSIEDLPRQFHMGKYCKARASVYHSMSHWEYILFRRVRTVYKVILRASKRDVPSDSEMSSSSDDPDESDDERQHRRDLRREKRRSTLQKIRKLDRTTLPNYKDVDEVTQWMDQQGHTAKEFRWFNGMIEGSLDLERNQSTADD